MTEQDKKELKKLIQTIATALVAIDNTMDQIQDLLDKPTPKTP